MIKNIPLFALILHLFTASLVFAQKKVDWDGFPKDVRWGELAEAELTLQTVAFEPEAKVVTLFEEGRTGLIWNNQTFQVLGMYTAQYYRIKVLDDNVAGFGDILIPYYHGGEYQVEAITGIEAQVSYLDGEERKVYPLSSEDVKQIDLGGGFGEYRIVFPKVFKGSILEYRYIKVDRFYYNLEGWVFQGVYPTLKSTFTFDVPNFLQYQLVMPSGRVKASMSQTEEKDRFSWTLTDVRSFQLEPYISSPMDYLEQVEGFLTVDATRRPSTLYSTWQALGDEIIESKDYRSYLKDISYKKLGLKEDIFLGETQGDLAKSIYTYISTTFTLEPSFYPYPSKSMADLIRTKRGNHLDIHLLLAAVLREYGLHAGPVLVNELDPRKRSFLIPSPHIDQFSSSLVRLELGEETIYLDATDSRLPFGLVPLEKLVEKGFLITESTSSLVDLKFRFDSALDLDIAVGLDSLGNLEYRESLTLSHLQALLMLNSLKEEKAEEEYVDTQPYSVNYEDHFREKGFIKSSYHLAIDGSTEDLILLDPFTFSGFAKNPFVDESRTYPLEFGFPILERMQFAVDLPDGYLLDEYPEPIIVKTETGDMVFSYEVKMEGDVLRLKSELRIDVNGSVSRGRYAEVRNFFQIVSEKLSEPVVVVRESSR